MLYKEYGSRYSPIDGTPAPLVDDMGGLIESPPWTLGMVEAGDEAYGVLMIVNMTMR